MCRMDFSGLSRWGRETTRLLAVAAFGASIAMFSFGCEQGEEPEPPPEAIEDEAAEDEMDEAGDAMDDAADETGEAMEDAVNETGEALEDVGDEAAEGMEAMEDGAEEMGEDLEAEYNENFE